ncbi:MAG: hypothetical protein WAX69_22710 [Victivallales bacterium]
MNRTGLIILVFACLTGLCAIADDIPRLEFQKIIGDMRGRGMQNLSVTVADDGAAYLLMSEGRIAVFNPDGKYARSLDVRLTWPFNHQYISAWGRRVLLGDYKKDYPWVFSERRAGDAPGRFRNPSMAAPDKDGALYVADTGNSRVQVFDAGKENSPGHVISLNAKPLRLDVRNGTLALLLDDQTLRVLDLKNSPDMELGCVKTGPGAVAVALTPDHAVLVAFNTGPDRNFLKKYQIDKESGKLKESSTIAPSYIDQWPNLYPVGMPMTSAPDGSIWFATSYFGRILALDPVTDKITEKIRSLGSYPLCVGFGSDGKLFVGGSAKSKSGGRRIQTMPLDDPASPATEFPNDKDLYNEDGVPVWSILPDKDGGVFVRIIEEGYQKGWPAMTIKKVLADGTMKPFVDFGHLYAKRTTFHPAGTVYSMQFDRNGDIILAALPLVAVYRIAPDGKIVWEAGLEPQGGADKIEFGAPRATAIDSHGRIWVADTAKNKVFCLSPRGKLLFEYGTRVNVDDIEGKGFDNPSAVAIATVNGADFLYVGDSGNQRIVKYRIMETQK